MAAACTNPGHPFQVPHAWSLTCNSMRLLLYRALDYEPEDPSTLQRTKPTSLRARLQHLMPPMLRLVLALTSAFLASGPVTADAAGFVAAHAEALARVLREAAAAGGARWVLQVVDAAALLLCLVVYELPNAAAHAAAGAGADQCLPGERASDSRRSWVCGGSCGGAGSSNKGSSSRARC